MYFVYILRCADGSYSVGLSENPRQRLKAHNEGRGSLFTSRHLPVGLIYTEPCGCFESALKRERQLKRCTRAKKEALVAGDVDLLRRL